MEKLLEVISFILQKSPNGRDRLSLSKLIYYSDGVYFQKNAKLITNQTYIHLEDSPCALDLQSALLHLRKNGLIDIHPRLTEKGISGFQIVWTGEPGEEAVDLNRQEKRIIRKV
ncbi:type II toxin-antitoxin system antitoxin SocA domain-containing protein, partial [Leptospira interrogans]